MEVASFEIDRTPVTNGDYLEFVEEGGYRRRECGRPAAGPGASASAPSGRSSGPTTGACGASTARSALEPGLPVMHVSAHEAEAYARARGKRLPTEAEWEKAATWDPDDGRSAATRGATSRRGREPANLDLARRRPGRRRGQAGGASAYGVLGLTGEVWEWTSGDFLGYPGFARLPLPRVLGDLLRQRHASPARRVVGHAPDACAADVPQLGLSRAPPALRRLPLRQGRLSGL